ncbi:MAG: ribonucleoside triphosphate reductase [Promethearchaeia archaeon]
MPKHIIKRDGRIVSFNKDKITNAIKNAAEAVGFEEDGFPENVTQEVVLRINEDKPSVEEIQNLVEKVLIEKNYAEVAKAYIIYREQHKKIRDTKALFEDAIDEMKSYLGGDDWKINENSNMSFSLQGLNNHIATEITSHFWLKEIYPKETSRKHLDGDIHIHDLGSLSVYCCGWDLFDVITEGFGGVKVKIESKPPRHFKTALGQIVNFLYTLQGEASGAQAFSNFDTYLAPFIAYDGLDYEETYQAMQEFIFNMNVPTRVGFQTPFSNLTMDLTCPDHLKDTSVIIGGEPQNKTYGEFQKEMDMLNKAFAEIMLSGDSKNRVFSFPIPTYNITNNFDWDNPVYKSIWEMTAKYGIPYFSNFINSDMDPEDARSMCCRLRINNKELRKRGGGLFGAHPLTGSVGVVTINMPRIGYTSSTVDEFKEKVLSLMEEARQSLMIKRSVLERLTESRLYPYSKFYLRKIKDRFSQYWKNHFNTIGINGMNEACQNLFGKEYDLSTKKAIEFTKDVMDMMNDELIEYQRKEGLMFNLEATPAESTAYRFARKDRKKFGDDIICANQRRVINDNAEPYYTNSTQLPVGYTDDIFEALNLQDDLQKKYTGGTVLHGFIGEKMPDTESTKRLVKRIAENYELPYYSITPTFSICPVHGYLAGEHYYCPKCEAEN